MKKAKIILIAASAAMLLTGCMSRQETEALSAWTAEGYTAQAMAVQQSAAWRKKLEDTQVDEPEIERMAEPAAAHAPEMIEDQAGSESEEMELREIEPQQPLTVMEMASSKAVPASPPTPAVKEESASAPAEPAPIPRSEWPYITCPPEATPAPKIDWPYPAITCPPEPAPMPQPEWPESPTPTKPDPTPVPTPVPPAPDPTPAPTPEPERVETPTAMPEPTPIPAGGYALCSCGTTLTTDELVPHMKAHALNGENHSYVAY